ncbi:MAG: hypothetical protein J6Z41_02135 [Prevotella sp.]|nr:hypothetical protein [Prevotella sp.]
MKKLLMMVLVVLGATSAFAADSDALKAIMKAASYAEAKTMIEQSLSQLANDQEKAKAYNKLVDLALDEYNAENKIVIENETNKQLGKEGNKPVDEAKMYTALMNAFEAALECDKYDQLPDAKGKVKPKFADANDARLYNIRPNLINGGIYYQGVNDQNNAYKFLAKYVDTVDGGIFAKHNRAEDGNLTNIAYFATIFAFQAEDFANAERYADIAANDPEKSKEVANMKLAIKQAQLKTHADSIRYIDELKAKLAQAPNDEVVFGTLCDLYSGQNDDAAVNALVEQALASNPNNTMALAVRGRNFMYGGKYAEAIADFKKVLAATPDNSQVNTFIGFSLVNQGVETENKALFEEAVSYLEKARQIDPERQLANWAAPLRQAYYNLYGAEDSRYKDVDDIFNGRK